MKSSTSFGFSSSLLFFFIVAACINVVYSEDAASIVVNSDSARSCSYNLMVMTGVDADAGTDSRISVTLSNSDGKQVDIPDLKEWGTMPSGHDYFENGNQDTFRVNASVCFSPSVPVCKITVTSDGNGQKPGWFLGDVEVGQEYIRFEPPVSFNFDQWLDKDVSPFELTASVNKCKGRE